MTIVVSTLLWEDQISRLDVKNFGCSRGWYENGRVLIQDAPPHGRNWARIFFYDSLKMETVSYSKTLLITRLYGVTPQKMIPFYHSFRRKLMSLTVLRVSWQPCEHFAQKHTLACLTNVACDRFRRTTWKCSIIKCNRGLRKCISLLWRVRSFSSPGAARSRAKALSNAEGACQLHGVIFSEL